MIDEFKFCDAVAVGSKGQAAVPAEISDPHALSLLPRALTVPSSRNSRNRK